MFSANAQLVASVLDQAVSCASTDDTRKALNGVYLHEQDGPLTAVGADGFRLIEVNSTIEVDDIAPAIYALDDVKRIVKTIRSYKRSAGTVICDLDQDACTITTKHEGGQTLSVHPVDATFPNYEQLIPPDGEACRIAVNGRHLADAGRLASKYSGSGIARLYMGKDASTPMRFEWQSEDEYRVVLVVMPIFVKWAEEAGNSQHP